MQSVLVSGSVSFSFLHGLSINSMSVVYLPLLSLFLLLVILSLLEFFLLCVHLCSSRSLSLLNCLWSLLGSEVSVAQEVPVGVSVELFLVWWTCIRHRDIALARVCDSNW